MDHHHTSSLDIMDQRSSPWSIFICFRFKLNYQYSLFDFLKIVDFWWYSLIHHHVFDKKSNKIMESSVRFKIFVVFSDNVWLILINYYKSVFSEKMMDFDIFWIITDSPVYLLELVVFFWYYKHHYEYILLNWLIFLYIIDIDWESHHDVNWLIYDRIVL